MRSLLLVLLSASFVGAQCFPEASCRGTEPPATQVIASGDTIRDNACGTVKPISATGAVTTNTTNTITTPSAGNAGCLMLLCNVGAQAITLDHNANFLTSDGNDLELAATLCVPVGRVGTVWRTVGAAVAGS